jgi:hypothetical protein
MRHDQYDRTFAEFVVGAAHRNEFEALGLQSLDDLATVALHERSPPMRMIIRIERLGRKYRSSPPLRRD